jgi:ribose 5-phosphate isomerase B
MKIYLGADHGGWQMKEEVKKWLGEKEYEVKDMGAIEENKDDDYVDFAVLVAKELSRPKVKDSGQNSEARGILFCRNGFGMMITANRFDGVRSGLGFSKKAVEKGRLDDDINCLAIPADYVETEQVKEMVEVFLKTGFSGEERHMRRLLKLKQIK